MSAARSSGFAVRRAAVLGAGVMGAQIAAHLVNANVEALLFELPAKDGDPNGNVLKAIDNLRKLEPSPLAVALIRSLSVDPSTGGLSLVVPGRPQGGPAVNADRPSARPGSSPGGPA